MSRDDLEVAMTTSFLIATFFVVLLSPRQAFSGPVLILWGLWFVMAFFTRIVS